jgi:hypothetical protein
VFLLPRGQRRHVILVDDPPLEAQDQLTAAEGSRCEQPHALMGGIADRFLEREAGLLSAAQLP